MGTGTGWTHGKRGKQQKPGSRGRARLVAAGLGGGEKVKGASPVVRSHSHRDTMHVPPDPPVSGGVIALARPAGFWFDVPASAFGPMTAPPVG
jgi:hypothetical protein